MTAPATGTDQPSKKSRIEPHIGAILAITLNCYCGRDLVSCIEGEAGGSSDTAMGFQLRIRPCTCAGGRNAMEGRA